MVAEREGVPVGQPCQQPPGDGEQSGGERWQDDRQLHQLNAVVLCLAGSVGRVRIVHGRALAVFRQRGRVPGARFEEYSGVGVRAGTPVRMAGDQLNRVPAAYRSPDGTWVGTSGRAHVVWYNTDRLSDDELPDSIVGFTDPAWRGRMALDPASRSLLDVVTELRQLRGDAAARQWLEGIRANAPTLIQGAKPIIKAVAAGELIDVGFGSHSYLPAVQADGGCEERRGEILPRRQSRRSAERFRRRHHQGHRQSGGGQRIRRLRAVAAQPTTGGRDLLRGPIG
jgi:hypothetical protein